MEPLTVAAASVAKQYVSKVASCIRSDHSSLVLEAVKLADIVLAAYEGGAQCQRGDVNRMLLAVIRAMHELPKQPGDHQLAAALATTALIGKKKFILL